MKYNNIITGKFVSRPNRFIANVDIDGKTEVCHVKNTGRCRELLIPGVEAYMEESGNPARKTKFDLVAVKKGERLINIDSQAPNKAAAEFLPILFPEAKIRPETKYENSRFDFYIEHGSDKIFLEVKGVTLESNGVVSFPDAPTERGVKHINELIRCINEGYKAYILFVIQMKDVKYMIPNDETHKEFGDSLRKAEAAGVNILAVDCNVTPDSMIIQDFVPILL